MPVRLADVVHVRMQKGFPSRSLIMLSDVPQDSAARQTMGASLGSYTMFHSAQLKPTLGELGYRIASFGRLCQHGQPNWMSMIWRLGSHWPVDRGLKKPFINWLETALFRYWRTIEPAVYDSLTFGRILTLSLDHPISKSTINPHNPDAIPIAGWCCSAGREDSFSTAAVAERQTRRT